MRSVKRQAQGYRFHLSLFFCLLLLFGSCANSPHPSSSSSLQTSQTKAFNALKERYALRLSDVQKTQEIHQQIKAEFIQEGRSSAMPILFFTAGPMGAGKTFVLEALARAGYYEKEKFATVNPDLIAPKIPEYRGFYSLAPEETASILHKESGQIADELLESALKNKKNVIVDGSLRNAEWYRSEFQRIRREYPSYGIFILYVKASAPKILERIAKRAADPKDGRYTPKELALHSIEEVATSIQLLRDFVDSTLTVDAEDSPFFESIYQKGKTRFLKIEIPIRNETSVSNPYLLIKRLMEDPRIPMDVGD